MSVYLVSYRPLIFNRSGREAAAKFHIPPFIDGSIRREPDFESPYPSITALCRGRMFAPRLKKGDTVVYITVKGDYLEAGYGHWRLVAVLNIKEQFLTHSEAANWYVKQGLPLPSNCLVRGNLPLPLEKTVRHMADVGRWDAIYQGRTRRNGNFLACESVFLELHNPPIISQADMWTIFGRIPATRTPPQITEEEFRQLEVLTI